MRLFRRRPVPAPAPTPEVSESTVPDEPSDADLESATLGGLNRPVIDETFSAENVATYYDEWNDRYEAVFGDVFQHLKAGSHDELLDHLIAVAGIGDGEAVLDAGCGVCGPARHVARSRDVDLTAVTVSPLQAERARELVDRDGLNDRISVRVGDFHHLDSVVEAGSQDVVYFLEALVHAHDPEQVLRSVFTVLKPGGRLYIKDFYRGRSEHPDDQRVIDECVEATNRICHLTIRNTEDMLRWVSAAGFDVEVSQALAVSMYSIDDGHEFCRRYELDVAAGRDFTTTFYLDNLEILARKPR